MSFLFVLTVGLVAGTVSGIVGTIGSGWLSDRYDNRYLLFWYYGLRYPIAPYGIQADVRAGMGVSYAKK